MTSKARGSASTELLGFLPLLLIAMLAAWQLLLVAFTAVAAENAARTASRVEARGGQGEVAALRSLPSWLSDGATATMDGTKATVGVEVPIIFPGFTTDVIDVERTAELPSG